MLLHLDAPFFFLTNIFSCNSIVPKKGDVLMQYTGESEVLQLSFEKRFWYFLLYKCNIMLWPMDMTIFWFSLTIFHLLKIVAIYLYLFPWFWCNFQGSLDRWTVRSMETGGQKLEFQHDENIHKEKIIFPYITVYATKIPFLDIFMRNATEKFEEQETDNSEQRNVTTIDNECLKWKKLWMVLSHIFVAVAVPQNS